MFCKTQRQVGDAPSTRKRLQSVDGVDKQIPLPLVRSLDQQEAVLRHVS